MVKIRIDKDGDDAEQPAKETQNGGSTEGEAAPRPTGVLAKLSTDALRAELTRRSKDLRKLVAKRNRLRRQLDEVIEEIKAIGGDPDAVPQLRQRSVTPRGPRAKNPVSLAEAIAMAVEVRAIVTPTEVAKMVKENGFQSNAKNFPMMVANTLARDERFKRIARGQYQRTK